MSQLLGGPGVSLPRIIEYPAALYNAPYQSTGNEMILPPGYAYPLPAGWIWVDAGKYCVLQYYDPITTTWRMLNSVRRGPQRIWSDGFNFRLANLTGCVVGAVVTSGGAGYVQATTTVTAGSGNSTWQPIVGGTVTISVTSAGANYTIAPSLVVDPPQSPGVQATAHATIANGTVSAVVVDNMGAGYQAAPPVHVIACPTDPNIATITNAVLAASIIAGNQGKITAVLCTNSGAPVASAPSLTIAGAGSTATATALLLQTATGATVAGGGGYDASNEVTTTGGGVTAVAAFTNPAVELTDWTPRRASMTAAVAAGTMTTISKVGDGGLFLSQPSPLILSNSVVTTATTATITLGSVNDLVLVQPA